MLIKKAEEGFRRLLTPSNPLNKKKIRFPLVFQRCENQIIDKCHNNKSLSLRLIKSKVGKKIVISMTPSRFIVLIISTSKLFKLICDKTFPISQKFTWEPWWIFCSFVFHSVQPTRIRSLAVLVWNSYEIFIRFKL